eukprot:5644103-Ditylum_brightwellii.AAC.2
MPSLPQSQPQREALLPSLPDTPVPPVEVDATVLGTQEYELKYKEAPRVLPDPVPSLPLPPAVLCCSICPCKLNIKYGFEDN